MFTGQLVLFGYAIFHGDLNRLIYGYDVAGDVCGVNNFPILGINYSGKQLVDKRYP